MAKLQAAEPLSIQFTASEERSAEAEPLSTPLPASEERPAESIGETRTQHLRSKQQEKFFALDDSGTFSIQGFERSSDGKNLVGVAIYNIGSVQMFSLMCGFRNVKRDKGTKAMIALGG